MINLETRIKELAKLAADFSRQGVELIKAGDGSSRAFFDAAFLMTLTRVAKF